MSGLYIGVEGSYRRVDPRGCVFVENDPAEGRHINATDAWEARLRV